MPARLLLSGLFALIIGLSAAPMAQAQGQFSPVITVNDAAITGYEIDQRERLLTVFRTPGNIPQLAREQLIEDRLKGAELQRAGLQLTEEALRGAMEEFAGRANLSLDQFLQVLAQNNIAEQTLRDFVRIGVTWRDYVRTRYSNRANVTEADIDRALGQAGDTASGIEVLLSEIIIPAPPPQEQQALATAQRIAQLTSQAAFEAEARRVSALPSRANGGKLGWLPISNYPPALRGIILDLGVGQVTAPLPIPNGVALFQMRGVREVRQPAAAPSAIDYAAYYVANPSDAAGLAAAQSVANQVDTCDDLYGVAQGQPAEVLERDSLPPSEIPQDVALELARLDPGEVSYNLTRSGGQTRVLLMLCGRTAAGAESADRDTVRGQLLSQRLAGYADALLADLRASAVITGQ